LSQDWLAAQRADTQTYPFLALRACFTPRVNLVLKWIGSGKAVLDVAGGDGAISERIRLEGNAVTLLDFPEAIARASRYPDLKTVPGECHKLPFSDGTFDILTGMEILEHYEDPASLLREWTRVVKPGGSVIVTTPDGEEASMKHLTHKTWFNRRKLGRLFQECGLKVRRAKAIEEQMTLVLEGTKP